MTTASKTTLSVESLEPDTTTQHYSAWLKGHGSLDGSISICVTTYAADSAIELGVSCRGARQQTLEAIEDVVAPMLGLVRTEDGWARQDATMSLPAAEVDELHEFAAQFALA